MRTTLYFIRHGETDFNRASIMQGRRIDSDLNETGRRQAEAVATRLSGLEPAAIYSSGLNRAVQTAKIIAELHPRIDVTTLSDLEEMSWGIYDGRVPGKDIEKAYARWRSGDYGFAVPEGESVIDVQERGMRALRIILEREEGNDVVVVTHGRFLRIMLATLLEDFGLSRMDEIKHANTGVNHIVCAGGRFEARLLNCTAHLSDAGTFSLN